MAFFNTSCCNTRKLSSLQSFNIFGSAISHTGSQATHKLIGEVGERPFEGDAAFDSLRHQLAGSPLAAGLPVSFARSLDHRPEAAHSAISFERASLAKARAEKMRPRGNDRHALLEAGDRAGLRPGHSGQNSTRKIFRPVLV